MQASLHRITTMTAARAKGTDTAWLEIKGDGGSVVLFIDYDMAQEIADLWEYMNREPEPPTFDEALAAKCDADARMDEARKLKGML